MFFDANGPIRLFQWTSQPPFEHPSSIAFSGEYSSVCYPCTDTIEWELDFGGTAEPVPEPPAVTLLAAGFVMLVIVGAAPHLRNTASRSRPCATAA